MIDCYNEIKDKIGSLNNKTVLESGITLDSEQIVRSNVKTALDIFKPNISEPMTTILACKNPEFTDDAMNILFTSGYGPKKDTNNIGATHLIVNPSLCNPK